MSKDIKLRIKSGILALVVAGGITIANAPKAFADEAKPQYKEGTFIEMPENYADVEYGMYVVKEGDNASRISEKICRHQGEEISTKFWPVVAKLNGFPRVLQPGDIIIFPAEYEDMEEMLKELKKSGWVAKYIQKNDVYGKNKSAQGMTVMQLLAEIYGREACTDPDFVRRYLRTVGQNGRYDVDSVVSTTEDLFRLTEWIPTLDELGYQPNQKPNNK